MNEPANELTGRRARVCIELVALRQKPEMGLEIVGVLREGDVITIEKEQDGFYQTTEGLWLFDFTVELL